MGQLQLHKEFVVSAWWFCVCYTHEHIYTQVTIYICMYVYTYKYTYFVSLFINLDMSGQFALRTQNWRGSAAGLCHPRVHPHSFYRRTLPVFGIGWPAQHDGRVEIASRVFPVAAVVGAAGAAEAVDRRAAHFLPRRLRRRRRLRWLWLLLLLLLREPRGSYTVPGRWNWFRFYVDVLVGING